MHPGNLKFTSLLFLFFLVWLAIRFLFPLFSPFLLGALLALSAEPMVRFLHKRLGVPRGVSAGIGVSMTFSLMAILLLSLCALLIRELGNLGKVLPDWNQTAKSGFSLIQNWMLQLSAHTPESLQPFLRENVNRFFSDGAAVLVPAIPVFIKEVIPGECVRMAPIDGMFENSDTSDKETD